MAQRPGHAAAGSAPVVEGWQGCATSSGITIKNSAYKISRFAPGGFSQQRSGPNAPARCSPRRDVFSTRSSSGPWAAARMGPTRRREDPACAGTYKVTVHDQLLAAFPACDAEGRDRHGHDPWSRPQCKTFCQPTRQQPDERQVACRLANPGNVPVFSNCPRHAARPVAAAVLGHQHLRAQELDNAATGIRRHCLIAACPPGM